MDEEYQPELAHRDTTGEFVATTPGHGFVIERETKGLTASNWISIVTLIVMVAGGLAALIMWGFLPRTEAIQLKTEVEEHHRIDDKRDSDLEKKVEAQDENIRRMDTNIILIGERLQVRVQRHR